VILNDSVCRENLQGYKIGRVTSKTPLPASPLFAKITIEPSQELKSLRDVSVVVNNCGFRIADAE